MRISAFVRFVGKGSLIVAPLLRYRKCSSGDVIRLRRLASGGRRSGVASPPSRSLSAEDYCCWSYFSAAIERRPHR